MSVSLLSASLSPGFGLSWQMRVVMEICSELGYGVIDSVGGHTECLRDGICPESRDRDISSESESESESGKVVGKGVPLHPPPLQGSDVSALLMITFKKGWPRSPQIIYVEGLWGVSNESPQCVLVHEHLLLVPRSYVQFHILPT